MRIAIGADHRGLELKQSIIKLITGAGHSYKDCGSYTTEPVDYPDIAKEVAGAVARGDFERGILICNNGIGMSIAANKMKGVRAALCHDELSAQISRDHNDSNVICLSGDQMQEISLRKIVEVWLTTDFSGGRHQRRVNKIAAIEQGLDPRTLTNG